MLTKELSRRKFLAASAVAVIGTALSACAPTPAPAEVAGEDPVVPEPALKEAVTIRFAGRTGVQGDHFVERARAFEEEYPEIKVEVELAPGEEYHQKMEIQFAGGTQADTFWTVLLAGLYHRYATKGELLPLDDYIAAHGYDLDVFYPETIDASRIDGTIYGLAWICHPGRVGNFYNVTMLEDEGMEPPPTDGDWDFVDLVEKAKALTKDTTGDGRIDQFGFRPGTDLWSVFVWYRSCGAEFFNEDGTQCVMDSDEGMQAVQYLHDLYHVHKVAPTPEQIIDMMFETGKVGMYQAGYWGASARDRIGDRFEMSSTPLPKGPAGVMGSMYEFDPNCIYRQSRHPEESFEFLKWMANQETGIRIAEVGSVPGARPDVWEHPRLTQDPMHVVMADIMSEVMPFRGPGNYRGLEVQDAITQGLTPIWLGDASPEEVVPDVATEVQRILDQPPL